jgi:hypothetical protein
MVKVKDKATTKVKVQVKIIVHVDKTVHVEAEVKAEFVKVRLCWPEKDITIKRRATYPCRPHRDLRHQ